MRGVTVRSYPEGPRVWVGGQRIHHGASGLGLAAALLALRRHRLCLAALLIVAHDARDWRIWFAREAPPTT